MRIRYLSAARSLSALMAVSACGGRPSTAGASDTIKLGAWLPLPGPTASVGSPQRAGMNALISQVNDTGGVNGGY
ncbi:ABC-type branched-subunit amino acid transport system substrate-binding protein [Arthrobacter bambusae]|nr:ABC-type branched-subunit amino acid transport system substrate-binding protein [Arthrobacter bambusae]